MTIDEILLPAIAPTLADVARLAGVSIATASRVLNNSARVSAPTRQQVRTAANRLGYVRHRAAPQPPRRQVRSAAGVLYANRDHVFADPFFARLIGSVTDELARHGVPLVLIPVNDARLPMVERYLHDGHCEGVVVLADQGDHPLAVSLPAGGIPTAVVGRPPYPTSAPYVDADHRAGAREAVEYLIARDRRAIATIAGPPHHAIGADRLAGYRDAVASAGLAELPVAYGDWTHATGVHAMSRLLDHRPGLDAVFVASDVMASGALHALHRAGRQVPDDVAVIGFDDLALAARTQPALTTVRLPVEELGVAAARRLIRLLDDDRDDGDDGASLLPTTLVIRDSA